MIVETCKQKALETARVEGKSEGSRDFRQIYQFVVRLAQFCPWEDVREQCSALLSSSVIHEKLEDINKDSATKLQKFDARIPSRFGLSFEPINWDEQIWKELFMTNGGRVSGLHWCLSTHIEFLENYFQTM